MPDPVQLRCEHEPFGGRPRSQSGAAPVPNRSTVCERTERSSLLFDAHPALPVRREPEPSEISGIIYYPHHAREARPDATDGLPLSCG